MSDDPIEELRRLAGMARPTKCCLCGQPMYYRRDPLWEPEVSIQESYAKPMKFAHLRCLERSALLLQNLQE